MSHFAIKSRLVFLPLIPLALGFIAAYGLLYWIVYVWLGLSPLKQEVIEFWVPIGLALICIFLYIRPRVHLLKLDAGNGRIRGLYYIIAGVVLFLPTLFTVRLIETGSGKLTVLKSITEITARPATKYYRINSFNLDKNSIGVESVWSYSGKRNESLNFDIYIAVPVVTRKQETGGKEQVYLCVKYHQVQTSKLSDELKEIKWKVFWDDSFEKFNNDPLLFTYLGKIRYSDESDNFLNAVYDSPYYKRGQNILLLEGFDESFGKRTGNNLLYIGLSLGIGLLVWFFMVIIPGIHLPEAEEFVTENKAGIVTQAKKMYESIKVWREYIATAGIIGINTLVFVLMVLLGYGFIRFSPEDLLSLGACYGPKVNNGEWWRLLASMFLHGGFIHLLMNMVGLVLGGMLLEKIIGVKKFVLGYLITGIAAALVSLSWHDKPVVAVGASGAIFGVYGILLAMIVFRVLHQSLLLLLGLTAGYGLLMGFLTTGVDNSAHVGGLTAGFIIGIFFSITMKKKNQSL